MARKLIDKCLRCGRECEDLNMKEFINYKEAFISTPAICKSCRLIFDGVDWIGQENNRIRILFVFPRDRCRFCYGLNPVRRRGSALESIVVCGICGKRYYSDEFYLGITITFGLAKMILDGKRVWDDVWYGAMPVPEENEYRRDSKMRFIMSMMFGNQKNFKSFGVGYGDNTSTKSLYFGEVKAEED
jgi:hypothetical protein